MLLKQRAFKYFPNDVLARHVTRYWQIPRRRLPEMMYALHTSASMMFLHR